MTAPPDPIPTRVPDGEPAVRCPYCGRPFPRERLRTLHVGERHADASTDGERAAAETAAEAEADDLFVYHLKVIAAIVLVAFFLAYTYAFVLA
ncbi:DUF7410 domain-containing protein [Halomarina pelagica]|uniref:DUF7410 domain-containing protein n=1 Tax=Halomarina pelagica TaxID=2961599 RepID=UPI0020C4F5E1|nr:C2H2-type zinc finger protein [Halomarina sp. BND7]